MRIWDLNPGYLSDRNLLGEHSELHGLVSILVNKRKGYSRHPETLRWANHGWALRQRHRLLICEMALRGFSHRSPVYTRSNRSTWPAYYLDSPERQFHLLRKKYADKPRGRIPIPLTAQQLWSQHKYSIMARDPVLYKTIGPHLANSPGDFAGLALRFTDLLKEAPTAGGIRNAVQHMWGYVSADFSGSTQKVGNWSLRRLLRETQRRAMATGNPYLSHSTALGELMAWIPRGV